MDSIENHLFIIFCGHGHNALGIIRSLHEKKILPILIVNKDGPENYADRSNFIKKKHYVHDSAEALELLIKLYGHEKFPPFVFTTDDYHTELLNKNYDRLVGRFYFFNCGNSQDLSNLQNKDLQCHLAEQCGFTVPVREVVKKGEMPKTLHYPIITKTISSNTGGWKKDVHLCQNEEELGYAYNSIAADTLLLEEYIKKKCEITIQGISLEAGDQVYIPYYSEDYSFSETGFGDFLKYHPLNNSAILEKAVRLIKKLRFTGLFGMDLITDQHDNLFFLEVNLRSDGKNYAITAGGANLPYLWAVSTINNSLPKGITLKGSFYAVNEVPAIMNQRKNPLKWMSDLRKANVFFWYYKWDNRPLRHYFVHKILKRIKKAF